MTLRCGRARGFKDIGKGKWIYEKDFEKELLGYHNTLFYFPIYVDMKDFEEKPSIRFKDLINKLKTEENDLRQLISTIQETDQQKGMRTETQDFVTFTLTY